MQEPVRNYPARPTLFLFTSATCVLCFLPRHLIADHIGWFKESTQDGKFKTIEDLLRAKGELVQRGKVYDDGTIEILPETKEEEKEESKP